MKNPPPPVHSCQSVGISRHVHIRRCIDSRSRASLAWLLLFLTAFTSFTTIDLVYEASPSHAANVIQATQPPPGPPIIGTPIEEALESRFELYFPFVDGSTSNQSGLVPTRSGEAMSEENASTPTATWTPAFTATPSATPDSTPGSTLGPTPLATATPIATATTQNGSAGIPPTPDPVVAQCNAALVDADTPAQVLTVEEDLACVEPFVDLLLADPMSHMDAFYGMITSTVATNELWDVTYDMARRGEFRTTAAGVEDLWVNLADVIGQCEDAYRCPDWEIYVLPLLTFGEMYRCPALADLSVAELVESVPYGDYYCTEDTAAVLSTQADENAVNQLVVMGKTLGQGWSRRNVLRVLGRLAAQPSESAAHIMVTETLGAPVSALMLERLENEADIHVLNDAIWVIDTFYFPTYDAQPYLEVLSAKSEYDSTLRFRAMGAISRLIDQRHSLSETDLTFLEASLASDDVWVRAQAAFTLQLMEDVLPAAEAVDNDPGEDQDEEAQSGNEAEAGENQREYVVSILQDAYDAEAEFTAKASMAQALDAYNGTELRAALQVAYEGEHLPNESSFNHITIRSGLPEEELPAFMLNMQRTESTFFEVLGPPFDTPVSNDPTEAMTLILFATRDEYREYMNAFVGYGAEAGGLYLESWGKLYTYQREPGESAYTVEHLVQHEFTHYLQGRYVFPGLWTDPGYHTEPKGWVDEGTAEFFGMAETSASGTTSFPLSQVRLNNICGGDSYMSLDTLLNRRAGYDQPGTFDYDNGWAFVTYLLTEQKGIALDIYGALRDGSYRVANFANIASVSVTELEFGWHQRLAGWCADEVGVRAASVAEPTHSTEVVQVIGAQAAPQPPAHDPLREGGQVVRLIQEK